MDTKPSAFWKQNAKSGVLVFLISVLSIAMTGCDTVSSADSHPMEMPTAPKPATAANTENPSPSAADSAQENVAKAPAPASAAAPATAPVSPASDHKPTPAPISTTQAKGGERLVAMASAPAQPPANETPASPASKPGTATSPKPVTIKSSTPAVAPASEAQGLYFKGPERKPQTSNHVPVWIALGVALCAIAAGAVVLLSRLSSRPRFSRGSTASISPREEIALPDDFKTKEATLPLPEENTAADDEPPGFKDDDQPTEPASRLKSVL